MDFIVRRTERGELLAETKIDLGFDNRRLDITTRKNHRGLLVTRALCVTVDGNVVTYKLGLARQDGSDYYAELAHSQPARVTEKKVREQHFNALAAHGDRVLEACKAYYA